MNQKPRIVVIGGGESGVGAALLASQKGYEVLLSDGGTLRPKYRERLRNAAIELEEGGHQLAAEWTPVEVVKSPGIPRSADVVQLFLKRGIPVVGELEFAGRYTRATVVGITGTNGKTTTTNLVYHILKRAGLRVAMGGNVGVSLAWLLLDGADYDYLVLEISSFQLDDMSRFQLQVAVLLNITPDHLDRYHYSVEEYADSKLKIGQLTAANGYFVFNADDELVAAAMLRQPPSGRHIPFSITHEITGDGAHADHQQFTLNLNPQPRFIMSIQELALQGKHNLYNSMAAGIATRLLDVRKELIRECLSDFQNVEHRLEHVNNVYGISFINDSKATNVNSAWYALESMSAPVVWIAGGVDKGNDYSQLAEMARTKVKALVCLGKDNSKLLAAFGSIVPEVVECSNMRDAVYAAYKLGQKGDAVLLSPACASFDLFADYEDRGRQFKEAVRNL